MNSQKKCSFLFTGDSYLDEPDKLRRFVNCFQKSRIEKVAVFQVMHHGSENNWHKGVAGEIAPAFSVFSSDSERLDWGHPDAAVLRDFLPFHPIQVDKSQGASFSGLLANTFTGG